MCSTAFCFDCSSEPHAPASCEVKREFTVQVGRLKAHIDSVELKTIPCPGCGVPITKNGGCNHMTCSQCDHEFCWICLSANWQDHVCNVFDSLVGVDNRGRLQFFSRRVDAHLESADITRQLLHEFDDEAQKLQSQNRFCRQEHLYVLKESWRMLVKGRSYLANTYVAAYGLPASHDDDDPSRREFQEYQSQLQLFVEQLSFLSDSVPNLYRNHREEDLQTLFRGLHFCTVAVAGYMQRMESAMASFTREQVTQNVIESESRLGEQL
jgi:ariadne-1